MLREGVDLASQPLTRGEQIEVSGVKGIVEQVGTVDTQLRDGQDLVSIPNASLLDQTVRR